MAAIAGRNAIWSALNVAARLINNPDGLAFTGKVAKVALPFLQSVVPAVALAGVQAANNLILGEGKKEGVGLSFFADRFSPITYGAFGLSKLLNWGSNPMDPLTDAAFLGAISDGFGIKRVLEIFNQNVDTPVWNSLGGLLSMNALGGLTALLFASFHLKGYFEDSSNNYRQANTPKIWGNWPQAGADSQPVWAAQSRAAWKLNVSRVSYTLWIGMIALPFLRASGASLPILKSLNHANWTAGVNALRGALWIAGTVIGMDLVKMSFAKDRDGELKPVLPEDLNNGLELAVYRAQWNETRETHFEALNYGIFDWFKAGVSFIADKSIETHSWACRFTKLPQAGLLTAELFFECVGKTPWAAFTGNAARNLRAWRKMGKVAKVITQPIAFVQSANQVYGKLSSGKYKLENLVNVSGSAIFSMMYDWGSMTSFVAARAGYPLQGRVKTLFDNAAKRWCCIPMAFSLAAQAYIQYDKGAESSFYKVFYATKISVSQRVLGSNLDGNQGFEAPKASDYQDVANFVSRAGLTMLTMLTWYRGGSTKATDLAISLFDGMGAASGVHKDWQDWLGEHKDGRLKEDILNPRGAYVVTGDQPDVADSEARFGYYVVPKAAPRKTEDWPGKQAVVGAYDAAHTA